MSDQSNEHGRPKRNAKVIGWLIAGAVLVVLWIIGTIIKKSSTGSDGYAGWTTSITKTTCTQWTGAMTDDQRFAMSKDMVQRLGAKDTSDSFAHAFVGNVSTACAPGVSTVGDVAAGLATLDTTDFN